MRIVLDTNVVVSALLWRGTPHRLHEAIRRHAGAELFTSAALLDELARVLARPFAASRLALIGADVRALLADYALAADLVTPLAVLPVSKEASADAAVGACPRFEPKCNVLSRLARIKRNCWLIRAEFPGRRVRRACRPRPPPVTGAGAGSLPTSAAEKRGAHDQAAANPRRAIMAAMGKTLELAIAQAAALPEAAQEQLGREMLDRIGTLAALRAAVEAGLREFDAGKGEQPSIEDIIAEARKEHAGD